MGDYLPAVISKGSTNVLVVGNEVPDIAHKMAFAKVSIDELAAHKERYEGSSDKQDRRVLDAIEALESGRMLISLQQTFRQGGNHYTYNLPKLAIASARSKNVVVYKRGNGQIEFHSKIKMNMDLDYKGDGNRHSARSAVPAAPIEVRKQFNLKDKSLFMLFEANWTAYAVKEPRPPIDPALIQQVAGDLWAVLACWELSGLEQAALLG
jgi:hypothetical protein